WACSEFQSTDGTHPSATGRDKVADSLLAFVRRDSATAPWYTIPGTLGAPAVVSSSGLALTVAPNPTRGAAAVFLTAPAGTSWRLAVVDAAGRLVREMHGTGTGSPERESLEFPGEFGARAGVYFARLDVAGRRLTKRLELLGSATGNR